MSFSFSSSKLVSCSFVGLDIRNTSFLGSIIDDTQFRECNLKGANFEGVKFKGTSFLSNNLFQANFKDASGFLINPCENRMKGSKFSHVSALELLRQFEIKFI